MPFSIATTEGGVEKEEITGDPAGGRLVIANQAIQHRISNLIEKVQQQDTTIRTQQQLLAAQQQSAELRIKTLEDLAAIRDRSAADQAQAHRAHIKIPQLILSQFSNKKEEWQEFWASFEISVADTSMDNKEKLTHLKTLLMGPAKKQSAISH